MIRAETAETQDSVSEQEELDEIDVEDMDELSFIPGAVSEPRGALYMHDNKCSKEGFKFYQLAAIVIEGGGAAHTINLCKQSHNERRQKQGERAATASRWREMKEQKAFGGKLRVGL